jgi:hypothetical protein
LGTKGIVRKLLSSHGFKNRRKEDYRANTYPSLCVFAEDKRDTKGSLLRRHFLNHGNYQLAITVIQVARVAPNLGQKAEFVIGQLRQSF